MFPVESVRLSATCVWPIRPRTAGEVTITRHGRPVLKYVLPPEEYRVGDNPAEAFSRIVGELFER